jgi:hypothetical protein
MTKILLVRSARFKFGRCIPLPTDRCTPSPCRHSPGHGQFCVLHFPFPYPPLRLLPVHLPLRLALPLCPCPSLSRLPSRTSSTSWSRAHRPPTSPLGTPSSSLAWDVLAGKGHPPSSAIAPTRRHAWQPPRPPFRSLRRESLSMGDSVPRGLWYAIGPANRLHGRWCGRRATSSEPTKGASCHQSTASWTSWSRSRN